MSDTVRELAAAAAYAHACEIAEMQRQKILANPHDPSWTEHLAEVGAQCRELAWAAFNRTGLHQSGSLRDTIEAELAKVMGKP